MCTEEAHLFYRYTACGYEDRHHPVVIHLCEAAIAQKDWLREQARAGKANWEQLETLVYGHCSSADPHYKYDSRIASGAPANANGLVEFSATAAGRAD
jgi:hypothetical protein